MNKKLISILLIISLLTVGFTCISATDLSANADNPESSVVTNTESSTGNTETQNVNTTDNNDNNTTNITENETDGYPDVVVPTKTEDLEKFNIMMNFVTPEGKSYFADQLAEIDNASYKDVIVALKNNDMEHLFYYLGQLDQNKIDTFFTTFLNIFDNSQNNTQDSTSTNSNSNSNTLTDTISNILGTSQSQKTVGNQFIKTNPNLADSNKYSNQNNPMYTFKNNQYSLIDFVLALKTAYENGEINYDQFIQVLKDNGIDTSDIKCENGVIQWGFLYIIGPGDGNNNTNSTEPVTNASSTSSNDTVTPSSNVDSTTENPTLDDSNNAKSEGNATA